MTPQVTPSSGRKDLQDLRNLSRAPILSYLQKQAQPPAPRPTVAKLQPKRFPMLGAFTPANLWKWITQYFRHRVGRWHPFQDYSAVDSDNGVYTLQGDTREIRIALAGDWATGTDEAAHIAKLIEAFDPHYSIHLGDVYYVGDRAEVDENFLGIPNPDNDFEPCLWPTGSQGTFALNGNHEMYSRGYAYFDRMLPTLGLGPVVNGKAQGQRASFFCLENEYWRIIALDTGYNSIGLPVLEYIFQPDCALRPELLAWIRRAVRPHDDQRGIILLSHHQYFSRFDYWYPKPAKQLAEFFSRPVLWFWGHEHRMAIYEEFGVDGGIRAFGRCVGHGGMPVDLPPAEPQHSECRMEFVDSRPYRNDENLTIGFNGFVRMALQANHLKVEYVDVHDGVAFSERWDVNNGTLTRVRCTYEDVHELFQQACNFLGSCPTRLDRRRSRRAPENLPR